MTMIFHLNDYTVSKIQTTNSECEIVPLHRFNRIVDKYYKKEMPKPLKVISKKVVLILWYLIIKR